MSEEQKEQKPEPPSPAAEVPSPNPTPSSEPPKTEDPAAPQPAPQPIQSPKEKSDTDSFFLQCLQYISFGKYYFVLAKRSDTESKTTQHSITTPPKTGFDDIRPVPLKTETIQRVFVVQGDRETLYREILEFLLKLHVRPVYLHKEGKSVESFEQIFHNHSAIKFAIVLLTSDDFVYSKDRKPAEAKLRARQDVVFKFGYLMAKLGRPNVFVLYHEQTSFLLPTDFQDALYVADNNPRLWKNELISRLKKNGYVIDENIKF